MTSSMWDVVADAARWARANSGLLQRTVWVNGNAVKLEVKQFVCQNKYFHVYIIFDTALVQSFPNSNSRIKEGNKHYVSLILLILIITRYWLYKQKMSNDFTVDVCVYLILDPVCLLTINNQAYGYGAANSRDFILMLRNPRNVTATMTLNLHNSFMLPSRERTTRYELACKYDTLFNSRFKNLVFLNCYIF